MMNLTLQNFMTSGIPFRVPFTEEMGTTGDGRLTLIGRGSLSNKHELSLVAKRWQAFNFDAEVKVKFDPFNYQQMAGLTNFYNDKHWSFAFVTWNEKKWPRDRSGRVQSWRISFVPS